MMITHRINVYVFCKLNVPLTNVFVLCGLIIFANLKFLYMYAISIEYRYRSMDKSLKK